MDLSSIEIQTERLLLLAITMEYAEVIFKEFQLPVTEFVYSKPATRIDETKEFIQKSLEGLKDGSNLQVVILDKVTKEFLGCAGLHKLTQRDPELGIWVKLSAHGHKYGREAITGLKNWADQNISYDHLRYPVVEQNIPSRKIPESIGGKIATEYDKAMSTGRTHHLVEYWIDRFHVNQRME